MKKLEPFKFFCLQNFPFIEEDFDALTNYELMCKIIEYLNKNIEKTNELGIQVQSLVNWFNNLDVQDEINNKLDAMAESGELAEIINQQIFDELNNKINTINSQITSINSTINPVGFYSGKNMVVFGESWCDPDIANSRYGHWVNRVASATGMTAFNFAKGAAAILTRPNNSYRMQLTRAINEMTATQKDNTRIVIMYMSDTDVLEDANPNNYVNEWEYLMANIQIAFPKAKIICIPFVWRCDKLTNNYWKTMQNLIYLVKRANVFHACILDNAMYWVLGLKGLFQNEYHPNESGYNMVAGHIINAIYGGTGGDVDDFYEIDSSNLDNVTDDRRFTVQVHNGQVTVEFFATFSVDKENALDWVYLPYVAIPQPDIMTGLYTADGNFVGTARATKANNRLYLKFNNVPANTTVFMAPLNYRAVANFDWT